MTSPAGPAYRIHTPRLLLRCWQPSDAPLLQTVLAANLDHLRPWMKWAQQEPTDLQTKIKLLRQMRGKFDLGRDFNFVLFDRAERQLLGGLGLHGRAGEGAREIGYWLHKAYTRRGLMTEAVAALTQVAFIIDTVDRLEIHCDPRNVASAGVARKLGFTHEITHRRRDVTPDGRQRDTMIWTLLANEYPHSPAATLKIEAYDVLGRQIL